MFQKACLFLALCSLLVLGSSSPLPVGAAGDSEGLAAGMGSSAALDGFRFLDGSETVGSLFSCSFGTCSNDFDCRRFLLLCPPGASPVCVLPGGASCSGNCSCGPVDQ